MTLPYTLTLVVRREAGVLPPAVIEQARELVSGAPPVILSDGEAVDIPCPPLTAWGPGLEEIRACFEGQPIDVLLTRSR